MSSVRINKVDVHAIDETVMSYYFDEENQKVAFFDLTVQEAENYIDLLQKAVEKAKESKYYQKEES